MSNFTFFRTVFHAICILKFFNSQISVVICSFFEYGIVSKMCIREWVNFQPFPKQALVFTCLQYKSYENTVGKGEIAHNEQFLLFPVFSTLLENYLPFSLNLNLLSANSFSLEESKICHLGKG